MMQCLLELEAKQANFSILAFSQKWVYLIEKAKLGLVNLPASYREVDPALFIAVLAPQQRQTDDESTPLLSGGPSNQAVRRPSSQTANDPVTRERIEAFFTEALDDQLEKIDTFYSRKEKELLTELLKFAGEISRYEGFDDLRQGNASAAAAAAAAVVQSQGGYDSAGLTTESDGETSSSSYAPPSITGPNSRHIRRSITSPDQIITFPSGSSAPLGGPLSAGALGGTIASGSNVLLGQGSLGPSAASAMGLPRDGPALRYPSTKFWNMNSHKVQRLKFRKQATGIFVALNDLYEYRELNHTGFSKILKKYEKVTGYRLKQAYMARVDGCPAFSAPASELLKSEMDRVVGLYARVATDGNLAQALTELKSHLREHIVWERNTIWRDMIEKERKTASLGIRRKRSVLGGDHDVLGGSGGAGGKKSTIWSRFWESGAGRKILQLAIILGIFAGLLMYPIFPVVEQQNCFAILVLASALWALEVIPLFVTSLVIPVLVVMLRVMRSPVPTHDGQVGYIRLPADQAAKRVFSEMFSPVIMLLLGGFSLAAALSKHHIAKGLASIVLDKAGSEPHYVLLANIFVSTFASMWISNVAAPVLCFSLIMPILRNLPSRSPYAKALVLGIALAANVGGMASPISSPQNAIAMGIMQPTMSWLQWFAISIPVCLVTDILIWLLLLAIYRPGARSDSGEVIEPPEAFPSRSHFADNPITWTQVYIFAVTALTIALWCVFESVKGFVGDMGIVAILPIVAFYGTGVLSKDDWNSQLWTVVILAMGGTSLGKAVDSSGLLAEITSYVTPHLADLTPFLCILLFSGIVLVVASFISHTVAALILLPVIAQIGANLPDPQPRMFVMAIALMCSGAMGLPVSSFPNMNAISLEDPTGEPWLAVSDFLKVGLPASVVAWGAIIGVGYPIMAWLQLK
ncbi:low-affinity phosphate transporter [Phlyctochytrium bullatum]|nr:low-affinity phosphate transporter [Phlyctochytrium bullatum]